MTERQQINDVQNPFDTHLLQVSSPALTYLLISREGVIDISCWSKNCAYEVAMELHLTRLFVT